MTAARQAETVRARPVRRISPAVLVSASFAVLVIAIVLGACGQVDSGGVHNRSLDEVTAAHASGAAVSNAPSARSSEELVTVHVVGAVASPGVYEVRRGARVVDALAVAGGATDTADVAALNLARTVVDGEQLRLPEHGEALPTPQTAAPGSAIGPVNLNSASADELEALPRVGPAMARRIIDYRTEHGGFRDVEELLAITGIGEKTFEALLPLVSV